MKNWRWAVVGTGYIAGEFAKGMRVVPYGSIEAVVSRSQESGQKYADQYQVPHVFTDFQTMIDEIYPDIVYIAVPNDCHFDYIMTALENGIPVLSEKPTVDNRRQLDAVMEKAKEKNLFFMEGMWTRCFPAVKAARKWIEDGRIGKPLTVKAFFDIHPAFEDWQPWKGGIAHAGGSLRDVGIYSLAMANMVFPGQPQYCASTMKSNGEVDESCRLLMQYENGGTAIVGGAFNQLGNNETEIIGEKGRILLGPEMWHPRKAALIMEDGSKEVFTDDYPETGFQYEIAAVMTAIENGEKQCSEYTWDEMCDIADLIENARKEWGIYYKADDVISF